MEFKPLMNIESSFKLIRLFAIVFVCSCTVITVYSVWSSYSYAEAQRQKIYVLDQGKSLILALSQDLSQNRPVEAKDHIIRFHELFFTLSPDKNAIEYNINRALALSDKSVFTIYKDLVESGYFNRIISGNVTQRIWVDSISCNFNNYPYEAMVYARHHIIRETTVTERTLVTTCRLRNTSRSDNNPHGFILENFIIKENEDKSTWTR